MIYTRTLICPFFCVCVCCLVFCVVLSLATSLFSNSFVFPYFVLKSSVPSLFMFLSRSFVNFLFITSIPVIFSVSLSFRLSSYIIRAIFSRSFSQFHFYSIIFPSSSSQSSLSFSYSLVSLFSLFLSFSALFISFAQSLLSPLPPSFFFPSLSRADFPASYLPLSPFVWLLRTSVATSCGCIVPDLA